MKRAYRQMATLACVLLLPVVARANDDDGKMYWGNRSTVQRANLDGSEFETIVSDGAQTASGIDIDPQAGKIYWAT